MKVLAAAITALALNGCATYNPTFPATAGSSSETLHVIPVLEQEEITVRAEFTTNIGTAMLFGVPGVLVGAAADVAINYGHARKAERRSEVLRAAAAEYDLGADFEAATTAEIVGNDWSVRSTSKLAAETDRLDLVRDAFAENEVDTVLVLEGRYQLTSSLDQIHVSIVQRLYPRAEISVTNRPARTAIRRMIYQSPIHTLAHRPYRDGEKDLVKDTIRLEYEQAIATRPDEEELLLEAMELELQEIDEATEISEDRAIAETWTSELLARYLDQAKSHLRFMLQYDWNERVKPSMAPKNLGVFYAAKSDGSKARQRGRVIGTLDSNTIYRKANGTLYSVPPTDRLNSPPH